MSARPTPDTESGSTTPSTGDESDAQEHVGTVVLLPDDDEGSRTAADTNTIGNREPKLHTGDRIGRYRLVRRLGAGGMGVVWVAHDPRLERTVAIKLLHEQRRGRGADVARERLRREALALARLSHPNVVAIYDVGIHQRRVFLAMEHIEGETLDRWAAAEDARPGLDRILEVFEQAAAGLIAVHEAGFVHRDFKPTNLMIDRDGRALVMDFGLARIHDPESVSEIDAVARSTDSRDSTWNLDGSRLFSTVLTGDGVIMGTPAYMAPEQHLGNHADARADQYSFCVTLFELVVGRRPFGGRTVRELATEKHAAALDFSEPRHRVSRPLRALLRRGLAPAPTDRFADMDALRRAIAGLRRRRSPARVVVVTATAGLGVVGGTWLALAQPQTSPCARGAEHIATVWNDDVHASLDEAFERTGLGYAPEVAERSATRLDAYAAAWAAGHRRVCEEAAERGADAAAFDLRMRCLSQARRSLETTLGVLVQADATAVQHAIGQVTGLPALARCDDVEALRADLAPPDDPETAAAIEVIDAKLDAAHVLERAGHFDQGHPEAVAALELALALNHAPTLARAYIRRGSLDLSRGDLEASHQAFTEATLVASSIGDHAAAADAATRLVFLCAEELGRADEALRWARHAEAALQRLPPDRLARARLDSNLGIVYSTQGRYDEALEVFERSYAIKREILGDDHPEVAGALDNVALAYDELGRHTESEALHRRSSRTMESVLGPHHPDYALSLMNLGYVVGTLGRHDEAEALYRQALEIYRASVGPEHPMVARCLGALGHAVAAQDRLEEAETYQREASELVAARLGEHHHEFAWALSDRASIVSQLGREADALALYRRAREIHEGAFGPEHDAVGWVLLDEAQSLIELERLDEADQALSRGSAILRATLDAEHPGIGTTHAIHGDLLHARGQDEPAADALQRALEISSTALGPDHPEVASVLLSLGEVELALGRHPQARDHLRRALEITESAPVGQLFPAEIRVALARASWPSPEHRDQARPLLQAAKMAFARHGDRYADDLAEIDALLRTWSRVPSP